jgi:FSR family fosmidomycin resistance protein-like MFS transporter
MNVNENLSNKGRRKVLGASGFAHFIHDGFTDTIYVLLPLWAEAFGLSHAQVGALRMAMLGALATFQIPAGYLAERIGERYVLVLGTLVAGVGFILLGLADGFITLLIFLIVAGVGCATQHPLASAIVSKAYRVGGRRAALGTYNFTGDLGKMAAPVFVASIAAVYGWQSGTLAYGLVGIVAAVIIFLILGHLKVGDKEKPEEITHNSQEQSEGWGINDVRGFSCLSCIGVIDSSCRMAFMTFVPFLLIKKGIDVGEIGFALALIFAGGAAGKLVCGHIAEKVGILRTVILTELITCGGILLLIDLPLSGAMILLPILGVALNGTSSVLYGTVGDFVDPKRQARAFGLFYTLSSGAMASLIYGIISDLWGLETMLVVLAASLLLVLPLCLILKPRLAFANRTPG